MNEPKANLNTNSNLFSANFLLPNNFIDDRREDDNFRNLEFEPLPEFLTEIPLDDVDSSRSLAVITTEPYSRSQLEVTTIPNDVMFPEDMFER